jgi:hypothetical protein
MVYTRLYFGLVFLIILETGFAGECPVLNVGSNPNKPSTMNDVVANGIPKPAYKKSSTGIKLIESV